MFPIVPRFFTGRASESRTPNGFIAVIGRMAAGTYATPACGDDSAHGKRPVEELLLAVEGKARNRNLQAQIVAGRLM